MSRLLLYTIYCKTGVTKNKWYFQGQENKPKGEKSVRNKSEWEAVGSQKTRSWWLPLGGDSKPAQEQESNFGRQRWFEGERTKPETPAGQEGSQAAAHRSKAFISEEGRSHVALGVLQVTIHQIGFQNLKKEEENKPLWMRVRRRTNSRFRLLRISRIRIDPIQNINANVRYFHKNLKLYEKWAKHYKTTKKQDQLELLKRKNTNSGN